ncbi:MAG: CorA family divalent cation transporter [Phycisphaerales bacterium]
MTDEFPTLPNGLIYAWRLDGKGGAKQLDWDEVKVSEGRPDAPIWVHLDLNIEGAIDWIREDAGFDGWIADALVRPGTRPRVVPYAGGVLVIVRGVNLNEGAEPEDMISLRMWAEGGWLITLRSRKLRAVVAMREALQRGDGPTGTASMLSFLLHDLATRRRCDRRSGRAVRADRDRDRRERRGREIADRLADLRRRMMGLKRYLRPQRDAVVLLASEKLDWMPDDERVRIREAGDRFTRRVEDLETLREEMQVSQDELTAGFNERLNQRMYVLAIVSAVFMPLGFVAGVFGMNVAVPFQENAAGFLFVSAMMLLLAIGVLFWMKRRGWF